ncbi:MAG: dUTP diphosphatase [Omnitrophica bacterium]|nr:dUTP diphosphatase [Candidatus Omnitrophota bacterium]
MSDRKSMVKVEAARRKMMAYWGPWHFTNMLNEMVDSQKQFATKFIAFGKLTLKGKERWTKELVVCMLDELSEVLGQINWKHHKKTRQRVDETEVRYELIDLLCFLLNLMLVWQMTPEDIFSMHKAKVLENYRRQKKGGGYRDGKENHDNK